MALAAGTRLGPYEIHSLIGAGGMGEVYKARDTRLGRDVAIKVLSARVSSNPDVRTRFEREARAVSLLNDPHICTLYDVGRHEDVDYLVMEYLEGQTIAARLEKGPLPVPDVLRYGMEIAQALDRAHRAGIVHRDLKPANIMLTGGATRQGPPHAKLMDFGLARAVEASPSGAVAMELPTVSQPVTAAGTIVGTLQYMAPEQLEAKDTDARTDVWALGCVLYEMTTRRRAFEGASQASLVAAIMEREPEPLARVQPLSPPALEHVVKRCLTKEPAERWQSARDVAHELAWIAQASGTATAVQAVAAGRSRRKITKVGVAAVLACAAVAGAFFVVGRVTANSPQVPTYTRLTFERGFVPSARFTPDMKNVIYTAAWEGRPFELFETRADGTGTRPLDQFGVLHSVASTGQMALKKGVQQLSELLAPGPLAVIRSSGDAPRDSRDDVLFADWSRDASTLAIVTRVAGEARLEMPPGKVLARTPGWFADVRVSPDGRRIAFAEHPVLPDSRGSVAVVDADGRNKTKLTGELPNITGLAWSPDAREIWFSGVVATAGSRQSVYAVTLERAMRVVAHLPSSIVLKDIAADGRVLMASERLQAGIRGKPPIGEKEKELGWLDAPVPVALSADGTTLLFVDQGESAPTTYNFYVRPLDGSRPTLLGQGMAWSLSPDGRWALVIRYGTPPRLVLVPTGAGDGVSLTGGQVETYEQARFLSDRRVVFVGAERGRPQRTWVQDVSGGAPRAFTPEGAVGVTTSPDGRSVAVTHDSRLIIVPVDGGEPKPVETLAPGEVVCQWSDDGRTLFTYRAGSRLDVFALDVHSGARRLWRTFELPDPAGGYFFNIVMTRDGRAYAYCYLRVLDELYVVEGLK